MGKTSDMDILIRQKVSEETERCARICEEWAIRTQQKSDELLEGQDFNSTSVQIMKTIGDTVAQAYRNAARQIRQGDQDED